MPKEGKVPAMPQIVPSKTYIMRIIVPADVDLGSGNMTAIGFPAKKTTKGGESLDFLFDEKIDLMDLSKIGKVGVTGRAWQETGGIPMALEIIGNDVSLIS